MDSERCGECGTSHLVCPECKGTHVTPLEPESKLRPTTSLQEWARSLDEDGEYTFTDICWDCGWSQDKHVAITIDPEDD